LIDTPQASVREAQQLWQQGRLREAIAGYQRLLERWPDQADSWFNLGVLQRQVGQMEAALASYQQALDRAVRQPEEVHLNRAVIYSDHLRQADLAERELRTALALNPRYPSALLNLANLCEDLGRREEAQALYERLLTLAPRAFEALARLANLQRLPLPEEALLQRLKAALADPAATSADRASLGFALGRLLDGCGRYETAFEAYAQANRDSRASAGPRRVRYDHAQQEERIRQLMASPVVPAEDLPAALQAPRPVFICGMFRSGSTLAEQLLAAHPEVAAGGELDLLPRLTQGALAPFPGSMATLSPAAAAGLARGYLQEISRIFPGARQVTDKRPDNFLLIGLIKSLFPHARIIHTTRDPLDNCLSIYFLHLDHSLAYALDLADIGHYYRQYRRLMAHWKQLFGGDILDVRYDSFVQDPRTEGRRLFEFLGLDWDERYLDARAAQGAVKTASVWQVREPIYRHSSGRARHYARPLAALAEYLADMIVR
jgi:tetratricopeptide (TPR) repeat protein